MVSSDDPAAPALLPLAAEPAAAPSALGALVALAAMAAAAGGSVLWFRGGTTPPEPPFAVTAGDLGSGAVTPLRFATPERKQAALAALRLPEPRRRQIEALLDQDRMQLGVLAFTDDEVADGDKVVVSAAGVDQTVAINKGITTVVTPYTPGGTIRVTAVDGGQDIVTIALMTAHGAMSLKRMLVGDSVEVAAP
ncbi:MAG TPA: hypothetical protein VL460_07730 [Caulobacteraceae bacterium]|jgi:hypothetical protein|nr:hypothetical protein [Caulobacteraceae bacterium]